MSLEDTFTDVYDQDRWKHQGNPRSGIGAGPAFVGPYIETLAPLLRGKRVVDLGFGDFTVAKAIIRDVQFHAYTGMEIVPSMVEAARRFENDRVTVMQGNMATAPLPPGEVCLIRQVLQHLNNDMVKQIIDRVRSAYSCVIVTDQIRGRRNTDVECGMNIRKFGLFLEKPPFDYAIDELVTVNHDRYTVSTVRL